MFKIMTESATRQQRATRPLCSVLLLALPLLGIPFNAAAAGIPAVSDPVCVPAPGMPCPGSASSSSSGGSRSNSGVSSYSSGGRSTKPSTNAILLKGLQNSIDQMNRPNPATLQKIRQTQLDGDQAQHQAVTSQEATEEMRRHKAQRDAEAARTKQLQNLSNSLKGLPGSKNSGIDLRPGGTPFFGQGTTQTTVSSNANGEPLRAAASSGFDTRGPLAGQLKAPPPTPTPPTRALPQEKPIQPEKLTPEIQAQLKEREALRARKKDLQESLEKLESKGRLTPDETVNVVKLKQEVFVTTNKEHYLTFTINESLP